MPNTIDKVRTWLDEMVRNDELQVTLVAHRSRSRRGQPVAGARRRHARALVVRARSTPSPARSTGSRVAG